MYLQALLAEIPDVVVVDAVATERDAARAILQHEPDMVLLDIELQDGTGFGVVAGLGAVNTYILFTTALDHRATGLLRVCGVPFITKPIDRDSLYNALTSARDGGSIANHATAISHLQTALATGGSPQVFSLPGNLTPRYIVLRDVIAIRGEAGKSCMQLSNGPQAEVPYTITELDNLLKDFGFFRIHIDCIISRRHMSGLSADGLVVRLSDGSTAVVSPKKLDTLREFLAEK
jgi:two-component system LytT family response regulator